MARSIKRALAEGGPLLWPRLSAGFSLTSTHPEALRHARRHAGNKRALQRMLSRAEPFLYDILVEIEARKLPSELALLPAIESHYNPFAYSPRHAAGLWQFIPGTARAWGLRNTKWYDGRLDTRAATEAALDYLEFLHRRFGDWLLALAAYNAGEGRVDRALEAAKTKGGGREFWKLKLPKETQVYVPKILGLAELVAKPGSYRIELPPLYDRAYFSQVPLKASMRLEELSRLAALPLADLQQSNPALKRSITDPDGPHYLYLPHDAAERLAAGLRDPASLKLALAPKGSSGSALPVKVAVASVIEKPLRKPIAPEATRRFSYTVQHGDTLWDISRMHHINIRRLAAWNGLQPDSPLQPGQRLTLWLPDAPPPAPGLTAVVYTVGTGETLATIAQRFGLEIGRICAWNDLARQAILAPGFKLKLLLPRESGRRTL